MKFLLTFYEVFKGIFVLELFDPLYTGSVQGCSIFDINKTYFLSTKKRGAGGFYSNSEKTNLADRVVQPLEIL